MTARDAHPSPAGTEAERRVAGVAWEALAGTGPGLGPELAEVLAGGAAERAVTRALRARPALDAAGRAAVAEAIFGVGLWRRRLRAQLGDPLAPPALLLAALVRDLGGREAGRAEALAGLPPGALPPPRPPPAARADRFSLPGWLDAELDAAAGPEADALAAALCLPGPVALRANRLRTSPEALAARLGAEGVRTRPGALAPACLVVEGPRPNVYGLRAWQDGLLEVQDEGSQLLGEAVGARAGEAVLDACAGAGGKTLLLASAVGPAGRVHAADPDAGRLVRLRTRALAAGAAGIVAVHGAAAPADLRVDRVLVDAPCSELGALRRGPDLRWRIDPAAFEALPALQARILERAAAHVRTGGRLVYATCTFRRAEDEEVAGAFERVHPEFERIAPEAPASALTPDGFLRTWPHRHGTDAFFAAAWVRRG
ncbi:RsmB/NOP family class I SAM-dependent RNA methyltransferase [Anaeromyxobacter sp. Red801]|uniref:RsmB/NOP family class I SAM-dependent RNA methyltransferase n=1 Tax=Anaeromyxobacter sp. Red801 TaxID=3411632 RepID=UPI003B9ED239